MNGTRPFTAVVLAADRSPQDPVAKAAGACCKALVPVGGTPMVVRVLGALDECREVLDRVLCGPPASDRNEQQQFRSWLATQNVRWTPPEPSPSASTLAAMAEIAPEVPVETHVTAFKLEEANEALDALRSGTISGAAVLDIAG